MPVLYYWADKKHDRRLPIRVIFACLRSKHGRTIFCASGLVALPYGAEKAKRPQVLHVCWGVLSTCIYDGEAIAMASEGRATRAEVYFATRRGRQRIYVL